MIAKILYNGKELIYNLEDDVEATLHDALLDYLIETRVSFSVFYGV